MVIGPISGQAGLAGTCRLIRAATYRRRRRCCITTPTIVRAPGGSGFVGGAVDGLVDDVVEIAPGVLPPHVQCWDSVYELAESADGQIPQFRFLWAAPPPELLASDPIRDVPPPGDIDPGVADLRDRAGHQRDLAARSRDRAGTRRDQAADQRDHQAEQRRSVLSLERDADDAGALESAADRRRSRVDRTVGAADRVEAEQDRHLASMDRSAAADDRRRAAVDGLTGVYARQAGLAELDRDLAAAARSGHGLVLGFVDVDHLKKVNDAYGHAAGDRLLQAVADQLHRAFRPYDLVIRYGGDEFLCVIGQIDPQTARQRFTDINEVLGGIGIGCSVTVGLATWRAGESAVSLIARADADLYRQRRSRSAQQH